MGTDFAALGDGVVLAELGGIGDGPFCAKHGAGCALVVLGTYIVDSRDEVPYPSHFVFRQGRENYAGYLRENVAAARASGAAVAVSVVSVDLDSSVDFLVAAEEAGADFTSWCLHSTMDMFVSEGLSSALLRRENWQRLEPRLRAHLSALRKPLIVKVRATACDDVPAVVSLLVRDGVQSVHVNLGDATSEGALELIPGLKKRVPCLIAGGGIRTVEHARRAIEAGADAVAVATAAMNDPELGGRLQAGLRERV